jgi:hypothetical protein
MANQKKRCDHVMNVVSFLDFCSYLMLAQYILQQFSVQLHFLTHYVLPGPPSSANRRTMLGPISSYSALVWQ